MGSWKGLWPGLALVSKGPGYREAGVVLALGGSGDAAVYKDGR